MSQNLVAGKSILHVGGVVHAYKDLDNFYGMKVNELRHVI